MKTKLVKFDPKEGYGKHITGESGCVNCGSPLYICLDKDNPDYTYGELRHHPKTLKDCKHPQPHKAQTIRDKPIEVGQNVALWEMWRWMQKGGYCPKCWKYYWPVFGIGECHVCKCEIKEFPRKLLETTIREVVPIDMYWKLGFETLVVFLYHKDKKERITIPYNNEQHPFVKADTPGHTNKQFIDLMLRFNPGIRKGWKKMWIWRWWR